MSIAVVIPAYNEVATIADVARRACRYADWVIVVDDGSSDGTADQLGQLPVTVLRHTGNQGKAASLWRGMAFATERGAGAVLTLDADGQHRPEDIPRLLAANREHPGSIIIAARLARRSVIPKLRNFANGMADFWISWAAGHAIRDTQSGFRLYPVGVLQAVKVAHDRPRSFVFESEILIEASRRGYYTECVAIDAIYRPESRASYYRPLADTLRIVRMVAWKLISRGLYLQGLFRSIGLLSHPAAGLRVRARGS